MPLVERASNTDSQSITDITAAVSIFTPTELSCVEELWSAYRDRGEDSGYVFLVYRDDEARTLGYACYGPHPLTQGTYDLYWEYNLRPWDIAAGVLILTEAGGRVTDLEGTESYEAKGRVLASNGRIHDAFLELITGVAKDNARTG